MKIGGPRLVAAATGYGRARMLKLRSLVFLPVLLAASCVFSRQDVNEPIEIAVVRSFEPGKTTAREVVERLGAPTEVVQLGRRTAYRYDCSTEKSTVLFLLVINFANQDSRSDRVWVFFDEKDVLTHCGTWFGTHRTQYALPWEDVHEKSDNDARDAERAGAVR